MSDSILPVDPDEGVVPVTGLPDVLAVYPKSLQTDDEAPVRDALFGALASLLMRHQERSAYAAAQADPNRATGTYQDGVLGDRSAQRVVGESDTAFRKRGLAAPPGVTRKAIVDAVEGVLADIAPGRSIYIEDTLDRFFVTDGTAAFHSFVGESPSYADRYYPDDAGSNGGLSRAQSAPSGALLFSDCVGRSFTIYVPDLFGLDASLNLVYAGVPLGDGDTIPPEFGGATPPYAGTLMPGEIAPRFGGTGFFVADGTDTSGSETDGSVAAFVQHGTTDALTTYQAIVAAVERLRGHSIRWTLIVDPTL